MAGYQKLIFDKLRYRHLLLSFYGFASVSDLSCLYLVPSLEVIEFIKMCLLYHGFFICQKNLVTLKT